MTPYWLNSRFVALDLDRQLAAVLEVQPGPAVGEGVGSRNAGK